MRLVLQLPKLALGDIRDGWLRTVCIWLAAGGTPTVLQGARLSLGHAVAAD